MYQSFGLAGKRLALRHRQCFRVVDQQSGIALHQFIGVRVGVRGFWIALERMVRPCKQGPPLRVGGILLEARRQAVDHRRDLLIRHFRFLRDRGDRRRGPEAVIQRKRSDWNGYDEQRRQCATAARRSECCGHSHRYFLFSQAARQLIDCRFMFHRCHCAGRELGIERALLVAIDGNRRGVDVGCGRSAAAPHEGSHQRDDERSDEQCGKRPEKQHGME